MARYADDMVFTFEYQHEAKRFYSKRAAEKIGPIWHRTSRRQIAAPCCVSRGGDESKSERRTSSDVQLSGGVNCYWVERAKGTGG